MIKVKMGERCEICGKVYLYLKKHMSTHSNEKFKCDTCFNMFSTKNGLVLHRIRKHNPQNHICNICNKKFSLPCDIRQHMKREHDADVEKNPKLQYKIKKIREEISNFIDARIHKNMNDELYPPESIIRKLTDEELVEMANILAPKDEYSDAACRATAPVKTEGSVLRSGLEVLDECILPPVDLEHGVILQDVNP